jgi:hypothetical protein
MRRAAATFFFLLSSTSIGEAQSVSDLYKSDRCSAPLRVNFIETVVTHKFANSQQLIQYTWCHNESRTEKDAQNQGFNLKFVYDELPIQADGHNDFQKALDWKVHHCEDFKGANAEASASDEFKTLINEKVAEAAFAAYTACINRSPLGLSCSATLLSNHSISYYASYIPATAGEKTPVVTSSSVTNASRAGATGAAEKQVFPKGTLITPQGRSNVFITTDLNKDVDFSVDLSPTVGSCPAVAIPAQKKYQVVASLRVSGIHTTTQEFSSFNKAIHGNCYDGVYFTNPATPPVCPGPGFVLDESTAHIVNIRNPGITPQTPPQYQSCFSAVTLSHSMRPDGCLIPTVQVRECTRGEVGVACDDAWKDGAGWGTQYSVAVSGAKKDPENFGPFAPPPFQNIVFGPLIVQATGLDGSMSAKQATFVVDIIPSTGTPIHLTEQAMSGLGASAFFDETKDQLVINLPQSGVQGFSINGILQSTSDVIDRLR